MKRRITPTVWLRKPSAIRENLEAGRRAGMSKEELYYRTHPEEIPKTLIEPPRRTLEPTRIPRVITSREMPINPGAVYTKTLSDRPSIIYKVPSAKTIQEQGMTKTSIRYRGQKRPTPITREPRPRLASTRSYRCPFCGRTNCTRH